MPPEKMLGTEEVAARLNGLSAICLLLFNQFSGEQERIITDRIVADALYSVEQQLDELSTTVLNREFVPEEGE